ncbi:hypothetical protein [Tsukamurella soli]|uniref:Uncharacterized protein n=1 Tax=Tsukamurella soli TaxID=644556 RepID=A0ABP8JG89_9ACTN
MTVDVADLKAVERAVLLVLAAEAGPVLNKDLSTLGPKLEKDNRDKLTDLGLIDVAKSGRTFTLTLTDAGWGLCNDLLTTEPPTGTQPLPRAMFTVLRALGRHLDRAGLGLGEIFTPVPDGDGAPDPVQPATAAPAEVEQRIRAAYADLGGSGGYIGLAPLRERLSDLPRADVDAALVAMYREPDVDLVEDENRKVLTDTARAAGLLHGGHVAHAIAIGNR